MKSCSKIINIILVIISSWRHPNGGHRCMIVIIFGYFTKLIAHLFIAVFFWLCFFFLQLVQGTWCSCGRFYGLTTLEKRRNRGDLIEACKIITGKESIQWERFVELAPSMKTREHRYKLFKKRKGTLGQRFFSARVVDLWNGLEVSAFKRKLG